MIIPIDDNHRIASDANQWIVQEKRIAGENSKNAGEVSWVNHSYYMKLQGAVNGLAQLKLRLNDSETLTDALDYIDRLSTKLSKALTPMFEVKKQVI